MKYAAIGKYRGIYSIAFMCDFFEVLHSEYYAHLQRSDRSDQDGQLACAIRQCQEETDGNCGYRRVDMWLDRQSSHVNHKAILRVMNKYSLLSQIRRRRKYRQMGSEIHEYTNLLNRDFTAERPNAKWMTDISYIHTGHGVLYLSDIRDLYKNSIVTNKTGIEQSV